MDPIKISGIKDWPTPKTVKDVRSFLGFCNFYRPFIRGFTTVAHPLNELTQKDAPWTWETRQQQVFATLKHQVTSEPILAQPVACVTHASRMRGMTCGDQVFVGVRDTLYVAGPLER
jgi:hypothetical protein